jgi:hypothetical protein
MQIRHSELVKLLVSMNVEADSWDVVKLTKRINQEPGISRYNEPPITFFDPEMEKLYNTIVADQAAGNLVEVISDIPEPTPPVPESETFALPVETPATEPIVVADPTVVDAVVETTPEPVPTIETTPENPETESTPKKPRRGKKPGKRAKSGTTRKMSYEEKVAAWDKKFKKTGAPITERGPGIIRVIVEELQRAGKYKSPRPVTKKQLLEVLKAKFPDRPPEGMWTYLTNLVPTCLRIERHIHCHSKNMGGGEKGYYVIGDGREPQVKETKEPKKAKKKKTKETVTA